MHIRDLPKRRYSNPKFRIMLKEEEKGAIKKRKLFSKPLDNWIADVNLHKGSLTPDMREVLVDLRYKAVNVGLSHNEKFLLNLLTKKEEEEAKKRAKKTS